MNIFKNKAKKKKLENQQQAQMEVEQLLRQMKNKLVSKAFADGFLFCHNFLFEKHLKDFDSLSDAEKEEVKNNLMQEVIEGNEKYLKNRAK